MLEDSWLWSTMSMVGRARALGDAGRECLPGIHVLPVDAVGSSDGPQGDAALR